MSSRHGNTFVYLGLIAATALSVVLARRLDSLSRAYRELQIMATTLHPGSVVPAFSSTTNSGHPVTVGATADSTGKQLILVFTTTCPYCKKSLAAWQQIADSVTRLHDGKAEVIGVSLDSVDLTSSYVKQHGIRFDVAFFPDGRMKRLFRATKVPQTIVVDYDGHVVHSHIGLLEPGPGVDSVFAALSPTEFRSVKRDSLIRQR